MQQIGTPTTKTQPEKRHPITVNTDGISLKFADLNTEDFKKLRELRNPKVPKKVPQVAEHNKRSKTPNRPKEPFDHDN